jgi:multiple sugar transport system substrate-binding protein
VTVGEHDDTVRGGENTREELTSPTSGRLDRRTFLKNALAAGIIGTGPGWLGGYGPKTYPMAPGAFTPSASTTETQVAIEIAKQYPGKTVNFQVEAGLQAAQWKAIKPRWEEASGTKLNIVEVPYAEQFQKALAAIRVGGEIDCLYCQYNWLPDFVGGEVLEPFNPYFEKYLTTSKLKSELADFSKAAVMANAGWNGQQWGYPIDGPSFTLFYRTDIFGDPSLRSSFKQKFGYELAAPTTWEQYAQIGQFLTSKLAPRVYGAVHQGQAGQAMYWWFQMYNSAQFGNNRFFDSSMNPLVSSDTSVEVFRRLNSFFDFGPPGGKAWGPVEIWSAFLKGQIAMTVTWPPMGRLAGGYGAASPLMSFVPTSSVTGKFAAAIPPGGNVEEASGYSLAIFSKSAVKDLAFAFLTWATAASTYLDILSLPFALLKIVRKSTFDSPTSAKLWPGAGQYYAAMQKELGHLTLEPKLLSSQDYLVAVDQACTAVYAGTDPKKAADTAAGKWDQLTSRVGKQKQEAVYKEFEKELTALRQITF